MSNLQEWLFRWCVRSALRAMPYTVRMFAIVQQECREAYPEDNAYSSCAWLREAFEYSAPQEPTHG